MIKWNELSINNKFMIILVMQNISFLLAWFLFDISFLWLFACGFSTMISLYLSEKNWTKKNLFIFSVIAIFCWGLDNSLALRTDANVGFNQLKTYSGITKSGSSKSGSSMKLGHALDNGYIEFECGLKYGYSCTKELVSYFGRGNIYNQDISVKYYEFSDMLLPITPFYFTDANVIYEIKHNGKIIFNYNYFIIKYHSQHREVIVCSIYLILTTLVFCILYHLIQKNFVQYS